MDGYGVGGVNGLEGKDEEVSDVGHDVGEDYEGHGCVDYSREISSWVAEFSYNVVCLHFVSFVSSR